MLDVLMHYREQNRYLLHEYVIMPDHLHLLLTPARDISLERAVQLIKGGFSFQAKRGLVWRESFTNHRIRDNEDYSRHAEYIRMNPVRARLVESVEAYPYSSADPLFQVEERPFMAARRRRRVCGASSSHGGYCTVKLVLAPMVDAAPVTVVPTCA